MNGPQDWVTTGGLIAATLVAAGGCAGAVVSFVRGKAGGWPECLAALALTLLAAGVFAYRALAVHEAWVPLEYHVDGLSLLVALLGVVVMYLQWTRRLPGLSMVALGLAAVLSLWGFCASWFTLREFDIRGVWRQVHLLSVYLGTLGVCLAAVAGAMWLYVDKQLKGKDHRAQRLHRLGRLASLEALELAVTRSALLGFVLLSVGLATGLVIVTGQSNRLGEGWWYSPKVLLAFVAWLIYALVMSVRHVSTFRGRRAAVLAIIGFILMLLVLGISQMLPGEAGTKETRDQGNRGGLNLSRVPGSPSPWVPYGGGLP